MLTLAAFRAPAQTGSAGFSLFAGQAGPAHPQGGSGAQAAAPNHGGSNAAGTPCCGSHAAYSSHATYWPCDLLNAFILRMAATGHCVSAAMMLGDRAYARRQLALARRQRAQDLAALSLRLQTYFDAAASEGCRVAAALGAGGSEEEAERGRLLLV